MINLLFGGNDKVYNGILLCLISISKNTTKPLNVYILTADVTELNSEYKPISTEQVNLIEKYLKQNNPKHKVTLITLGKEFNQWILESKNKLSKYTPFAFLRLFADTIPTLPDKIVYLDTDIMAPGDINELFSQDISNYEFAAVKDHNGTFFLGTNYFNSGVLYLNLPKIRNSQLFSKVKELCIKKKMAFPDQTALNKLATKVLYLPRKFNEQCKLKKDTVIQHFCKRIKWLPFFKTQNIKPWHIKDVQNKYKIHAYDDIYKEYVDLLNNNH